jgi:(p)ppGpp synthase/HD superfamily hydrolase
VVFKTNIANNVLIEKNNIPVESIMPNYAQTNLQLFNQLMAQGYTQENLRRVHQAYELGRLLFSGRCTASGRSQIVHCVGTASILAFWNAPAHMVVAGLVHNVYKNGDFGDGRRGISEQKRTVLKEILGKETEEEIANFAMLKWNEKNISCFNLGEGPLTPNLVFLRLADLLDHTSSGGHLYDHKAMKSKKGMQLSIPPFVIEASNVLGVSGIGKELERIKIENDSPQPLVPLHEKFGANGGFNVCPPSYTQTTFVKILKIISRYWSARTPSGSIRHLEKLIHHGLS